MINIKKLHLYGAVAIMFLTPVGAYYKQNATVADEIAQMRFERERDFAKKEELREISKKLDRIAEDLAEIKGAIKRR